MQDIPKLLDEDKPSKQSVRIRKSVQTKNHPSVKITHQSKESSLQHTSQRVYFLQDKKSFQQIRKIPTFLPDKPLSLGTFWVSKLTIQQPSQLGDEDINEGIQKSFQASWTMELPSQSSLSEILGITQSIRKDIKSLLSTILLIQLLRFHSGHHYSH